MQIRFKTLAIAFVLANFCHPVNAQTCKWKIDPRYSRADFAIADMVVTTLHGKFSKVDGQVNFDGKDLSQAQVLAKIDIASIDTGLPARDDHLRTKDFFDASKYPTMTFQSKRIERLPGGKFKLIGKLTLKGISKDVTLYSDGLVPMETNIHDDPLLIAKATTTINRKDFGITYNTILDNGGAMIGDDVAITINVGLSKTMPPLAMTKETMVKSKL